MKIIYKIIKILKKLRNKGWNLPKDKELHQVVLLVKIL